LRGQVKDAKTGEHLAGVTVTASIGNDTFAAITDENGSYELAPIPEGTYVVTFYYTDTAVEHRDVAVASRRVTPLYGKIDTSPPVIEPHGHGITIEHGDGTITDDYVESITIPLERFEARTEPSGDTFEGITFNGSEATEDAYYD
jgi:hypothetical protein